MKKIIICALVALMVIPFALLASSDVAVPAEPTLTSSKVVYAADSAVPSGVTASTSGGDTATNVLKTNDAATRTTLYGTTLKDGGKVVFVGKGYMGNADITIPKSTSPIMFTAVDSGVDYTSVDGSGNPYYMNASGKNDGQFGMFMIMTGKKVTFEGEIIFSNIVILSRLGSADASDPSKIPTIIVKDKVLIESSVIFAEMKGERGYNMQVDEGAYLYLHADAAGFDKYTGKGTIVIGDEIKASVTEAMFSGFDGNIVDKNGKDIFGGAADTETETETDAPGGGSGVGGAIVVPTYTGTTKVYIAHDKYPTNPVNTTGSTTMINADTFANGGGTLDKPYQSSKGWLPLAQQYPNGGIIVAVGKAYVGGTVTIPKSTQPYVITAVDNGINYTSRDGEGNLNLTQVAANPGQYGMFMIGKGFTLTFAGDVIFDNIVVYNRLTTKADADIPTIVFSGTGYIKENVTFVKNDTTEYYKAEIPAGGTLILEKLGFSKYTGEGTIAVSDALKATVTEADFAGFNGKVVDMQGNLLFAPGGGTEPDTDTDTDTDTEPGFEYVPGDMTPVELPAKPTETPADKVYTAHDKNSDHGITASDNGGASAADPYKTSTEGRWAALMEKHPNGATIVLVGKGFFQNEKITSEGVIVFTAVDGETDYTSRDSKGDPYYMNSKGENAGQYGMFMLKENATVTLDADVVFDNVVILGRLSANGVSNGNSEGKLVVKKTLWVKDNVTFAVMTGNVNHILKVEKGAVAFLDANGFTGFEGEGVIVLSDELKATAKPEDFAGFEGKVVDKDGNVIFSYPKQLVEIPERPTYNTDNKFYIAYDGNGDRDIGASYNGGKYAQLPYKTKSENGQGGWGKGVTPWLKDNNGGTLVLVGKCYIPANFAFPATDNPIVITAKDGGISYVSKNDKGGIRYQNSKGANDGQYGMFFIAEDKTVTFNGDVVFRDTVILNRLSLAKWNKGSKPATIVVKKTLTIEDSVQFANMSCGRNYILEVRAGAVAYLDRAGFFNYTGDGMIVIGDDIKDKVTAAQFGGFRGKVVDTQGNELFPDVNLSELPVPTGDSFNPAFTAILAVSALTVGAVDRKSVV